METIITSLLSSDIFLIEKPTYTATISAVNINYVSQQFPKVLNIIGSTSLASRNIVATNSSFNKIRTITGSDTISITGNYNTFNIKSGLVTAAYNTRSSEINELSSTITTLASSLSEGIYNVFFDTGSAALADYQHLEPPFGNGALQRTLTGTKVAPVGLTVGAQDIFLKVLYNGFLDNNNYFAINTAFPFVYLKDFDFSGSNEVDGRPDDYGNNYLDPTTRRVVIPLQIANIRERQDGKDITLVWKVLKFF